MMAMVVVLTLPLSAVLLVPGPRLLSALDVQSPLTVQSPVPFKSFPIAAVGALVTVGVSVAVAVVVGVELRVVVAVVVGVLLIVEVAVVVCVDVSVVDPVEVAVVVVADVVPVDVNVVVVSVVVGVLLMVVVGEVVAVLDGVDVAEVLGDVVSDVVCDDVSVLVWVDVGDVVCVDVAVVVSVVVAVVVAVVVPSHPLLKLSSKLKKAASQVTAVQVFASEHAVQLADATAGQVTSHPLVKLPSSLNQLSAQSNAVQASGAVHVVHLLRSSAGHWMHASGDVAFGTKYSSSLQSPWGSHFSNWCLVSFWYSTAPSQSEQVLAAVKVSAEIFSPGPQVDCALQILRLSTPPVPSVYLPETQAFSVNVFSFLLEGPCWTQFAGAFGFGIDNLVVRANGTLGLRGAPSRIPILILVLAARARRTIPTPIVPWKAAAPIDRVATTATSIAAAGGTTTAHAPARAATGAATAVPQPGQHDVRECLRECVVNRHLERYNHCLVNRYVFCDRHDKCLSRFSFNRRLDGRWLVGGHGVC